MVNVEDLLALNAVAGLGPVRIQKLLTHFQTVPGIFRASERSLLASGLLPAKAVSAIRQFPIDDFVKNELKLLTKHGASAVSVFDDAYPKQLKEIPDPPVVLYTLGDRALLQAPAVAIVGCRRSSVYGMTTAERLARELGGCGLVVASGLARGIDTAAHQGALSVQGKTIAVLGTGLLQIYPPENKKLFEAISKRGLIVSEFPMATGPKASHFPRRNRIISGLSLGVVVVEAAKRSGALITADCALEQGRDVFAVPGKVDSPTSQGVHELIKQGAKLVTRIEDILEELPLGVVPQAPSQERPEKNKEVPKDKRLAPDEQTVLQLLSSHPVDVDSLCQQSGLPAPRVLSALLTLELSALIQQLPGKLFVLK